jgi:hypothetical protein
MNTRYDGMLEELEDRYQCDALAASGFGVLVLMVTALCAAVTVIVYFYVAHWLAWFFALLTLSIAWLDVQVFWIAGESWWLLKTTSRSGSWSTAVCCHSNLDPMRSRALPNER